MAFFERVQENKRPHCSFVRVNAINVIYVALFLETEIFG
jgi:hypothetical protein